MPIILTAVTFAVYALNIAAGSMGGLVFLADGGEMLVLFAASAAFFFAKLRKETDRSRRNRYALHTARCADDRLYRGEIHNAASRHLQIGNSDAA